MLTEHTTEFNLAKIGKPKTDESRLEYKSLNFNFYNGTFHSYSGNLSNGSKLNTTSNLTLGHLKLLFMTDIELFNHNSVQFKESCVKAEFGYFDLNAEQKTLKKISLRHGI